VISQAQAKLSHPDLFDESPNRETLGILSATLAATSLEGVETPDHDQPVNFISINDVQPLYPYQQQSIERPGVWSAKEPSEFKPKNEGIRFGDASVSARTSPNKIPSETGVCYTIHSGS
jgi:hypothetical protein